MREVEEALEEFRKSDGLRETAEAALRLYSALTQSIVALQEKKDRLFEEVASLTREAADLSGQVSAENRELELLEDERERLQGEVAALRQAVEEIAALKGRELEVLEEERGELQARHAELLELHREALRKAGEITRSLLEMEARKEKMERDLAAAQEELARAGQALAEERRSLEAARAETARVEQELTQLRQRYQRLAEEGRPLNPYRLPARLPRLATMNRKVGTAIPELDYRALKLYSEGGGGEIAGIVTAALRNIIPHEHYHEALESIRSDVQRLVQTQEIEGQGEEDADE